MTSVCAVIISYNPGADLLRNVLALSKQVDGVVIVDNASTGSALDTIKEVQEQTGCSVIRNDRNLGIAAGLNIGFRFAIDNQYNWIVSFDQDSTVTDGFIQALLDAGSNATAPGLICPTYLDRRSMTEMVMPKLPSGEPLIAMTSGSMLHRTTYLKAGPFDEKLYIDSVDNEYCLRIRSMGMHIVQTNRAVLLHSLGNITFRRCLGRKLVATNHSPARRYYMMRNRLYVSVRYAHDWRWSYFVLHEIVHEVVAILFVERQKLAKIGYMIRGAFDFTRGRLGRQVPL